MRKEIIAALVVLAFLAGFLVGRAYPAHHYVKYAGNDLLLVDTGTGKVCDPLADMRAKASGFPQCGK